jgi:hypothetical protein
LPALRETIRKKMAEGVKEFRLTHLFQFSLFTKAQRNELTLRTLYPLPVCNSQSVLFCQEHGAKQAQAFVELSAVDCREMLEHSVLPLEYYAYGRIPVFNSRALLPYWKRFSP